MLLAFSREGPEPLGHVQDVMLANKALVWSYWGNPSTFLYFSGKAAAAGEVRDTLMSISVTEGKIGEGEAGLFSELHPMFLHTYA
jgi:sulfite reductase alpha subunit-like flavoprotein